MQTNSFSLADFVEILKSLQIAVSCYRGLIGTRITGKFIGTFSQAVKNGGALLIIACEG